MKEEKKYMESEIDDIKRDHGVKTKEVNEYTMHNNRLKSEVHKLKKEVIIGCLWFIEFDHRRDDSD